MTRLSKLTRAPVVASRPMTKPLDEIYDLILSEAMDPDEYDEDEIDLVRRMIAIIVTIREALSIISLGELLGMEAHRSRSSLNRLHAVIYVSLQDNRGVLSTFHASFGDFLTTPARAPVYMNGHVSSGHEILTSKCLETVLSF